MSKTQYVTDLKLKNKGGYTCDMYVRFKNPGEKDWKEEHTARLMLGQDHTSNPGKHGAVEGAQLGVAIDIDEGIHVNNDSSGLIFQPATNVEGDFVCSGTTLDPSLMFTGVHG
jgi:hypothetical protein